MTELFITIVGIVVAVCIAKKFVNDVEKEIAAHDARNILGDDDVDR